MRHRRLLFLLGLSLFLSAQGHPRDIFPPPDGCGPLLSPETHWRSRKRLLTEAEETWIKDEFYGLLQVLKDESARQDAEALANIFWQRAQIWTHRTHRRWKCDWIQSQGLHIFIGPSDRVLVIDREKKVYTGEVPEAEARRARQGESFNLGQLKEFKG